MKWENLNTERQKYLSFCMLVITYTLISQMTQWHLTSIPAVLHK